MPATLSYSASVDADGSAALTVRRGLVEHLPQLTAHARRLTRDRCSTEDLVHETVARALSFAWSFEAGTNLRAWLHQVMHSVFVSGCRRRARERRALSALTQDPCAWMKADAAPPMLEVSPPVQSALRQLPESFRDVVRLVDMEQLSYKDAAEELSVPLGTVMSRLHRARRLLATALAERETLESARAA